MAQWLTNPTRNHEVAGSIWLLLWPWCRPVAIAPIGPLVWELPYAMGAALEKTKKKKESLVHKI